MKVVFSGLDGAGKSTQINLLKNYLTTKGEKSVVIWSRGGYTPGMIWLKEKLRKGNTKTLPPTGKSKERDRAFQNNKVRKVWLLLSILDLFWVYGIRARVLGLRGYSIIFDRYAEDTLIDFELNFPQENVGNWFSWSMLRKLIPNPEKHFILVISIEESQRRSILKNEPFPDSKETLSKRLDTYTKLSENFEQYVQINCLDPVDTVFGKIKNHLELEN